MQIERLRSLIRESVKDHIKEIEAVAEAAAMEARLAEYDKAIETCENKIQTAENLEEVQELVDENKLNELRKKLKDLKKTKEKLEKQKAKKNKGKEVTTDAETDKEENVGEVADTMDETYVDETYTMDEIEMSDKEKEELKKKAEANDKEYNIMNESFLKMQKLAGIITETQYNQKKSLTENQVDEIAPPPAPGSPENLIRPLKSALQDLIKRAEELEADSEKEPYFVAGKGYVSQEVDNVAENVHRLKNIAKNLLDPKGFEAMKTGVYNLQYTKK